MKISPIIKAADLANLSNDQIVIVHAGGNEAAYENYQKEHLNGAFYVDLNNDLADIPADAKNGGRHPLPSLDQFAKLLASLGIDKKSHVIVYDDQNGANAAARFWWMLRAARIDKVQVLDGGLQKAKEKGLPLTSEIPQPKNSQKLNLKKWKPLIVEMDFIEKHADNPNYLLVDVRDKARYDGTFEPIDEIAGHIPGAINIPFKENLTEDGTFKDPETLYNLYAPVFKDTPFTQITVHCGSGVTACHTLLALEYAGFKIPNLYVGSWSEWSRNDKPIATNK